MPRSNRDCHHRHHADLPRLNSRRPSYLPRPTSTLRQPPPQTAPPPPPPPSTPTPTPTPRKPNTKILSLLLQALIMTLVISLFFVFVGVAAIIFIHLCIAGGALHRRHRRYRRQQQPYSDKTRPGCSAEGLKTLPITKFKAEIESNSTELCAICLENVLEGDWCRELPSCKHLFHSNCIDTWLLKAPACPVCRTAVGLNNSEGEKSEIGGDDCAQFWAVFR